MPLSKCTAATGIANLGICGIYLPRQGDADLLALANPLQVDR
jgi:hypothetical protein